MLDAQTITESSLQIRCTYSYHIRGHRKLIYSQRHKINTEIKMASCTTQKQADNLLLLLLLLLFLAHIGGLFYFFLFSFLYSIVVALVPLSLSRRAVDAVFFSVFSIAVVVVVVMSMH